MKLQPPGVPVDSHAVYSKDTGLTSPLYLCSFSFNSFSTFAFFVLPWSSILSDAHTYEERHSFQLVWSLLRANIYPYKKLALNLQRKPTLDSEQSFKEEFSSYWRIFSRFNEITCTITIKDWQYMIHRGLWNHLIALAPLTKTKNSNSQAFKNVSSKIGTHLCNEI